MIFSAIPIQQKIVTVETTLAMSTNKNELLSVR